MQKELTIFIICMLALSADALLFWQIINLRSNGNTLVDGFYGGAILALLIVAALFFSWFGSVLLRRMIDRALG